MPRRRPSQLRAEAAVRHWPLLLTHQLRELSPRALAEIARMEASRDSYFPGITAGALRIWGSFVGRPNRRLWVDDDGGCGIWDCCGNPLEARAVLEGVAQSLSRRSATEFRCIIDQLDDLY